MTYSSYSHYVVDLDKIDATYCKDGEECLCVKMWWGLVGQAGLAVKISIVSCR